MSSPIGQMDSGGHGVTAICFNQPHARKKKTAAEVHHNVE